MLSLRLPTEIKMNILRRVGLSHLLAMAEVDREWLAVSRTLLKEFQVALLPYALKAHSKEYLLWVLCHPQSMPCASLKSVWTWWKFFADREVDGKWMERWVYVVAGYVEIKIDEAQSLLKLFGRREDDEIARFLVWSHYLIGLSYKDSQQAINFFQNSFREEFTLRISTYEELLFRDLFRTIHFHDDTRWLEFVLTTAERRIFPGCGKQKMIENIYSKFDAREILDIFLREIITIAIAMNNQRTMNGLLPHVKDVADLHYIFVIFLLVGDTEHLRWCLERMSSSPREIWDRRHYLRLFVEHDSLITYLSSNFDKIPHRLPTSPTTRRDTITRELAKLL
jgi:hypothetical protein